MMNVFSSYALYYNLLYQDKDYAAESAFVLGRIGVYADILGKGEGQCGFLLDLGCGTGGHAREFSRLGFAVTGVDLSQSMLDIGKAAISRLLPPLARAPELLLGDARAVRLGRRFSVAVSLFHVMSYQTSEEDARAVLATAREHLLPGGLFLFDFWYGPGVLRDLPAERERLLENDQIRVLRHARPVHRVRENIVDVHYHINVTDKKTKASESFTELHSMRYWFLPELRHLAAEAGFKTLAQGEWMQASFVTDFPWNAWILLQA
jgi:SAM-dependent methyltransferase